MSSDEDTNSNAGSEDYEQASNAQSADQDDCESEDDWEDEDPFRFFDLPAELQTQIIVSVDDIMTVLALRLTCRETNKMYLRNKPAVLASVRNKLIRPILDHYAFLVNYTIPESEVLRPPVAGWPQLAAHTTQSSKKSELVLEILQHLPYFKGENHYTSPREPSLNLIDYKCRVVDWPNWRVGGETPDDGQERQFLDIHEDDELECFSDFYDFDNGSDSDEEEDEEDDQSESGRQPTPKKWKRPRPFRGANTICIASGWESGGITLMLDTVYGVIHECAVRCDCQTLSAERYFREKQEKLRDCLEILIRGYHAPELKETTLWQRCNGIHVVDYNATPAQPQPVPSMPGQYFCAEVDFGWVRHLLRKHGWPSSNWRKT